MLSCLIETGLAKRASPSHCAATRYTSTHTLLFRSRYTYPSRGGQRTRRLAVVPVGDDPKVRPGHLGSTRLASNSTKGQFCHVKSLPECLRPIARPTPSDRSSIIRPGSSGAKGSHQRARSSLCPSSLGGCRARLRPEVTRPGQAKGTARSTGSRVRAGASVPGRFVRPGALRFHVPPPWAA